MTQKSGFHRNIQYSPQNELEDVYRVHSEREDGEVNFDAFDYDNKLAA